MFVASYLLLFRESKRRNCRSQMWIILMNATEDGTIYLKDKHFKWILVEIIYISSGTSDL